MRAGIVYNICIKEVITLKCNQWPMLLNQFIVQVSEFQPALPSPGQRRLLNLKDSFTSSGVRTSQDTQGSAQGWSVSTGFLQGHPLSTGPACLSSRVDPGNLDPTKAEYTMHTDCWQQPTWELRLTLAHVVTMSLLPWPDPRAPHPWPSRADILTLTMEKLR